jgi:hypothetical protein
MMMRIVVAILGVALATSLGVGCTTRQGASSDVPGPLVTNEQSVQVDAENINAVVVHIANGQFDHNMYEQQTGNMRLVLSTEGGPYLFSIDGLVDPRELPASGSTVVQYSVSAPGQHTMHVALSTPTDATATEATATLDVRSVGGS